MRKAAIWEHRVIPLELKREIAKLLDALHISQRRNLAIDILLGALRGMRVGMQTRAESEAEIRAHENRRAAGRRNLYYALRFERRERAAARI